MYLKTASNHIPEITMCLQMFKGTFWQSDRHLKQMVQVRISHDNSNNLLLSFILLSILTSLASPHLHYQFFPYFARFPFSLPLFFHPSIFSHSSLFALFSSTFIPRHLVFKSPELLIQRKVNFDVRQTQLKNWGNKTMRLY